MQLFYGIFRALFGHLIMFAFTNNTCMPPLNAMFVSLLHKTHINMPIGNGRKTNERMRTDERKFMSSLCRSRSLAHRTKSESDDDEETTVLHLNRKRAQSNISWILLWLWHRYPKDSYQQLGMGDKRTNGWWRIREESYVSSHLPVARTMM